MKRLLLFCPLAGLLFLGCARKGTQGGLSGPARTAEKTLHIAVLGKSVAPYWSEVELVAKKAGEKLGAKVTFFAPQREDVQAQVTQLEGFISMGVDGIAFAASDPDAVVPVIRKALKRGIPCVAIDTDSPKSGRLAYIGTDNREAGRIAGETLAKLLGGRGKVIITTGSLTALNSLQRIEGFKEAISKYPGIEIVDTLCDGEDASKAVSQAEAALSAHPDLDAFYGVYALNGPAAAKAVKAAGKAGKVKIVCFDTTPEHMNYIKEGAITATVGQRPFLMGYLSVSLLYLMNKIGVDKALMLLPKDRIVDTGVDVVTKSNIEQYRRKLLSFGIPVKGW